MLGAPQNEKKLFPQLSPIFRLKYAHLLWGIKEDNPPPRQADI